MDALYKQSFPDLVDVSAKKTSEKTDRYNCIAWAFKDTRRSWWPNRRTYWPIKTFGFTPLHSFEIWFKHDGWEECFDTCIEDGYVKIALYTLNGAPTHAARQLGNGLWTSKLGPDIDLTHALSDLSGPSYGAPFKYYRKAT